ncbi:MAG: lipid-binding SYLF domain-containing protein [Rhodospirillales bacterium]
MRFVILSILTGTLLAAEDADVERLKRSAEVFQEIMQAPDSGVPQPLLDKSECVVVVPGLKKGAFIIGAKYGRGFVSCRKGNVGWGAPGAVRVEGGSIGLQIGGSETDVVMLVMNERGAKRLMNSKFTLGGDASVAAGPVGRTATAETDAYMTAEILTWSRSRGVFAGVSLSGATLRQDLDVNRKLYGKTLENKEVVFGDTKAPAAAADLLNLLNKYSSRK